MAMPSRAIRWGAMPVMVLPRYRIVPLVAGTRPQTVLSRVLFPAPFAPTRVTTFSSGTWRVTFFSAWMPP